jgi:ADP-ribose pyrophosphatase YjhB (NUDIX family)
MWYFMTPQMSGLVYTDIDAKEKKREKYNMEIKSQYTYLGKTYGVTYKEEDPNENLGDSILCIVHGYCFYKDKMVLVYHEPNQHWMPPGGGMEPGETWQDAVVREVKEETNMKVLEQHLIGYQDVQEVDGRITRHVRSLCIVEPYGEFVSDPDGDITKIELIDPKEYKKYFDWGQVGDRVMERVLELKSEFLRE